MLEDVVKTTNLPRRHRRLRRASTPSTPRHMPDPPPARSTFAVAALPKAALVEIEMIALALDGPLTRTSLARRRAALPAGTVPSPGATAMSLRCGLVPAKALQPDDQGVPWATPNGAARDTGFARELNIGLAATDRGPGAQVGRNSHSSSLLSLDPGPDPRLHTPRGLGVSGRQRDPSAGPKVRVPGAQPNPEDAGARAPRARVRPDAVPARVAVRADSRDCRRPRPPRGEPAPTEPAATTRTGRRRPRTPRPPRIPPRPPSRTPRLHPTRRLLLTRRPLLTDGCSRPDGCSLPGPDAPPIPRPNATRPDDRTVDRAQRRSELHPDRHAGPDVVVHRHLRRRYVRRRRGRTCSPPRTPTSSTDRGRWGWPSSPSRPARRSWPTCAPT